MHRRSLSNHRPSHPDNAGMEHVGFPPTRQTSGKEGGGVIVIMHGHRLSDHRPFAPLQCSNGVRRVFTDHADIACTKR